MNKLKLQPIKISTRRRKYTQVSNFHSGLIYDQPSTMISDEATPNCSNVVVENGMVRKMKGTVYFAQTDTEEALICRLTVSSPYSWRNLVCTVIIA